MKSGHEQMNIKDAERAESFGRIEANVESYHAGAISIASDVLGGAEVVVDVVATYWTDGPVIILSLLMNGFALRLQIEGTQAQHPPHKDFMLKLRQRIGEAKVHGDRFMERMADVRGKVEASLARNGGMRLVLLEMTAIRVIEPFPWYEARLDAHVESLGVLLAPETDVLQEFTARAMAGTIRSIGKDHQRRTKIRDRLASIGAAYEIDLAAEHAIVESGLKVGEVAAMLAERRTFDLPDKSGNTVTVGLVDGRICLYSMLDNRAKRRPVTPYEIAAAARAPAA